MKKIILVFLIMAFAGGSVFAFDILSFPPPVKGGDIMIDAGIGLRALSYSGAKWVIPPVFAQVEFALPVGVPISVGGMFTLGKYEYLWSGLYDSTWSWMDITIAGRANWHWGLDISWLDLYTGFATGYTISSFESSVSGHTGADYSGIFFSNQVGAHFYFTKNIGAMAEVGFPYWLKGGIALKF